VSVDVGCAVTIQLEVDSFRTSWYDSFFRDWSFDSPEGLLNAIADADVDVEELTASDDLVVWGLSGSKYWLLYVKGYLQYEDLGALDEGNVYFDYLIRRSGAHRHDPGLSEEFADPRRGHDRIVRRFADFRLAREGAACGFARSIPPIRCVIRTIPSRDTKPLFPTRSSVALPASSLDGYHRLFLARLFGVRGVLCDATFEDGVLPGE
jgi:hypothetical protein